MATTRLTLADLMGTNQISAESLAPFLKSLGISDYREIEGYSERDGSPMYRNTLTPEAMKAADGYSFGWDNYSTPGNTGQITAFDPSGQSAGTFDQRDKTGRETFMDWAKMAAMAVPGLGVMGIGPMGGMLGGLGSAGQSAVSGGVDSWGATLADSLKGMGLENVGASVAEGAPSFFEPGATFLGESVGSAPEWMQGIAGGLEPSMAGPGFLDGASFLGESVAPMFTPGAASGAGTTGLNAMRAAELAGYATNGALPSSAAVAAGSGLWGGIKDGIDALGGMKTIAPLLGAAAGAASAGSGAEATQQSKMDPRMEAMLYGNGGLLGQAQSYFNANKAPNSDMVAGADMRRKFLTDPSYAEGYNKLKSQGMGLLGGGVAANPFTSGQASLSPSTPMQFPRTRTMFGG